MKAGNLDTRIALQRKTNSVTSSGDINESWFSLVERWASVEPASGTEVNASEQWVAREQTKFVIRWSQEVANLSPLDRVICPASDAGLSPEVTRSVYDIIAVHEIGRNDGLRIIAARRVG